MNILFKFLSPWRLVRLNKSLDLHCLFTLLFAQFDHSFLLLFIRMFGIFLWIFQSSWITDESLCGYIANIFLILSIFFCSFTTRVPQLEVLIVDAAKFTKSLSFYSKDINTIIHIFFYYFHCNILHLDIQSIRI